MKRFITTKEDRAQHFLDQCNPEAVELVKAFKDEIDNLTVVESTGYDFIETDPTEEIDAIQYEYLMSGVDDDIIDSIEQFEAIYEALCTLYD